MNTSQPPKSQDMPSKTVPTPEEKRRAAFETVCNVLQKSMERGIPFQNEKVDRHSRR